jgi:hypothetical protein
VRAGAPDRVRCEQNGNASKWEWFILQAMSLAATDYPAGAVQALGRQLASA